MREDWVEVELGEVGKITTGSTPSTKISAYYSSNDYPFYKPTDLSQGDKISTSINHLSQLGFDNSRNIKPGSILVTCIGATIGKSALILKKGSFNQQINAIAPNQLATSEFLYYQIVSLRLQKLIKEKASSTTLPILNKSKFSKITVYLPPLPEQRAIVAKVETLFADLDHGIADLQKAQQQLKVYRQAVLKKAFEGELTREWREQQQELPGAEELLAQIQEERERHYQQQVTEWKSAVKEWEENGKVGKKPGKPKRVKIQQPFKSDELANLPELDSQWSWVKVDKISGYEENSLKAGPFGSSLKKSYYTSSGYKVYGQEQVIAGKHEIGNYYIDRERYVSLQNCSVQPQDILISLVGTVGKVLILPNDCEAGIINPRLVKVQLNRYFYTKFFKYYFESSFLKNLYRLENHGTTMDVLNLSIIKELPFPLCSPQEQTQIVKEIESRLSVCDQVERSIADGLAKAEALRQSILKKAFEGSLLTDEELTQCRQQPDWEPAAVLLERVRKEKSR